MGNKTFYGGGLTFFFKKKRVIQSRYLLIKYQKFIKYLKLFPKNSKYCPKYARKMHFMHFYLF